jgi:hypothetical protein
VQNDLHADFDDGFWILLPDNEIIDMVYKYTFGAED